MNHPKYQEYNGVIFCRDEKTGYYLNSTLRVRMHRYVWEKKRGKYRTDLRFIILIGTSRTIALTTLR